jgi:hypothetical protein
MRSFKCAKNLPYCEIAEFGGDERQVQKNRCPSGTTLRCFKRTPEPEQCSCVSRQKIEDLLE